MVSDVVLQKTFFTAQYALIFLPSTIDLLINWSTAELNTLLDPTTYLDYTDCWIQLVTAPTMAVTRRIQQSV